MVIYCRLFLQYGTQLHTHNALHSSVMQSCHETDQKPVIKQKIISKQASKFWQIKLSKIKINSCKTSGGVNKIFVHVSKILISRKKNAPWNTSEYHMVRKVANYALRKFEAIIMHSL